MKVALQLLAVLVLAALGVIFLHSHGRKPAERSLAPSMSLEALDGRRWSLESRRGRVVAVNFWATWCGPCLQEIPDLVRLHEAHRERCFELVGVAEASAWDDVRETARRFGMAYPILMDDAGEVGHAFGVTSYPRTFLIDAQGRVRNVFVGAVDRVELERALEPLLADAGSCPRV